MLCWCRDSARRHFPNFSFAGFGNSCDNDPHFPAVCRPGWLPPSVILRDRAMTPTTLPRSPAHRRTARRCGCLLVAFLGLVAAWPAGADEVKAKAAAGKPTLGDIIDRAAGSV